MTFFASLTRQMLSRRLPEITMFRANNTWHLGCQVAMMLEEIQVTPSHLLEIMGLAQNAALGAVVQAPRAAPTASAG